MFSSNKRESKGYRASWRYQPPQDGKGKSIMKEGKSFIWCNKHKKWSMHKTSKCKGIGINAETAGAMSKSNKDKGSKSKTYPKLILNTSKLKLQQLKANANVAAECWN